MTDLRQKNRKVILIPLGLVLGMTVLSFASVPLYRKFCQVTGWNGTTQRAAENDSKVYGREMIVQFNSNVDPHLPWTFGPDQRQVKLKVGADAFISYSAKNNGKEPIAGSAVFNVTPLQAGKYFNKTQCFCFSEQVLRPGQKVHMPVSFFIDPKIMDDRELRDLKTITLSYTFYRQDSQELEKATEKFYDSGDGDTPPPT